MEKQQIEEKYKIAQEVAQEFICDNDNGWQHFMSWLEEKTKPPEPEDKLRDKWKIFLKKFNLDSLEEIATKDAEELDIFNHNANKALNEVMDEMASWGGDNAWRRAKIREIQSHYSVGSEQEG